MKYYIGTLEEVNTIQEQICNNADLPNGNGTERWAFPIQTINPDVYAIPVPSNGWDGYTYEEMINGIIHPESNDVQFPQDNSEEII